MAEDPLVDAVDDAADEDRITLGQRIAGIKQPSYMPTTPQGPNTEAAPAVRPQFDPNNLPESVRPKQLKPEEIPAAPTGVNNPNLAALAKQQASLATPINPMDTATGKIKPQYKMGWGQRLLGTLSNAATGFSGRGGPTTYVGPGATNWRFGREEAQRQGELEGVNTQIKTQEAMDRSNEQLMRDAQKAAWEGQFAEARKGTAEAQKETADVKKQLEGANQNLLEEKANKLANATPPEPKTEPELALAFQTATQKGDKQAAARYRGALDELERQKRAGKDTTATDVAKAIQVAEYRGKEHDRVDQQQESERRNRYAELDKNVQLKYSPEKMAQAKAQVDAELKTKYDPKHSKVDTDADGMLGLTKSGKTLQTNKPGAQSKTPAKPTEPAPAGRVWVYNKQTGARGTIPQSQLKQATQGANSKYGTW